MESGAALRELLPAPSDTVDLPAAYAYPDGDAPWVRANFVSSVDGAATLDGRSGGLGDDTDHRIFALLRALADVVLVGAGTVRVEGYGPAEVAPRWKALRKGRTTAPPIAVVSRGIDLDLSSPLFTDTSDDARTIVLLPASVPADRRRPIGKVADVIVAGEDLVQPSTAIAALAERGYRRISCEGGPRLLAHLVAADRLDELCLTRSPMVVAGSAPRITNGIAPATPLKLRLAHLLTDDSFLFCRYVRAERRSS